MKIVYFTAVYPPYICGVSIVAQQLAEYFARKKHSVAVITTSFKGKGYAEKKPGLTIHYLQALKISRKNLWYVVQAPKKQIETIINNFQPDIIHLQDPSSLLLKPFSGAKNSSAPIIITHHFTPEYLLSKSRLTSQLNKSIATKKAILTKIGTIYNKCQVVTVPNPLITQQLKNSGLKVPVVTISNGVDLSRFHPKKKNPQVLSRFKLKPEIPTFLFSGRLENDKNLNLLIKAFAATTRKPHKQLLIVGSGAQEKKLKQLTSKLGLNKTIVFTGKINHDNPILAQIYASCFALINPSIIENQSLTSLETLASGLPVITTNTIGQKILIKDTINGLLVKPQAASLAKAIQSLLNNPEARKKMSLAARQTALQHDIKKSFSQMEKLYQHTIKSISK
ncbi:glycosyltransferase [Patescibacteria group bacterium]|nr:glycosyltransferase [Patescibacteria group bacterium]MBU1931553.1 glycosyltransferase [Patescibacteria group bacterium]